MLLALVGWIPTAEKDLLKKLENTYKEYKNGKSINVSGRMSVGRFEDEFQKIFGVRCNVKLSKWKNADKKAALASIGQKILMLLKRLVYLLLAI